MQAEIINIKIGSREWWSVYTNFNPKRDEFEEAFHFETKNEAEFKLKELLKET